MLARSWLGQQMRFDRVKRREFITLLGGATALPLAARAQQRSIPMIGFLLSRSFADDPDLFAALHRGLKDAGCRP